MPQVRTAIGCPPLAGNDDSICIANLVRVLSIKLSFDEAIVDLIEARNKCKLLPDDPVRVHFGQTRNVVT